MSYPFRQGDLAREELVRRAQEVTAPDGTWPGADILFKFTCEHCGERCTLQEPNVLYENGECFKCGKSTKIEFGGFTIHMVLGKQTHEEPQSITCPQCGMTSHNLNDIQQRYCGNCHQWHKDMKGQQ